MILHEYLGFVIRKDIALMGGDDTGTVFWTPLVLLDERRSVIIRNTYERFTTEYASLRLTRY